MIRLRLLLPLLALAAGTAAPAQEKEPEDFTKPDLKALGIKFVSEAKDPDTGFVVGGKNDTGLIRRLPKIAGRKIASLERDMRPGKLSRAGFLGKDESLLEVMAMDNRYVVDELGLTHQELARHLHVLGAVAVKHAQNKPKEIRYHGKRFKVEGICFRGIQESPFEDDTRANCNATVWNLATGKKLTFSLLVPHMIERYGFYEGKGTPYRVEPRVVLEVLDFIKPAKKP